jgi:hypothetical protein
MPGSRRKMVGRRFLRRRPRPDRGDVTCSSRHPSSSSSSILGCKDEVVSILRTHVKAGFLSRRDNRTEPGVLTPGTDKKTSRPEAGGRTVVSDLCRQSQTKRRSEHLAPLQHCQPEDRVQFGQGAVLQQFPNPTFRARAQLVRGSQRSIMNAAQGRPRKRGALHNRTQAQAEARARF